MDRCNTSVTINSCPALFVYDATGTPTLKKKAQHAGGGSGSTSVKREIDSKVKVKVRG